MIEIGLSVAEALEAHPAQRRLLRVAHARFDFAFAIWIPDAARQRHGAVVREHVAIERIDRRVVHVRQQDTLFEIVEHDYAQRAAQTTESFLVKLGPDARTRAENQQPDRLSAVAEGHHEEPCPPVPTRRVAHHRARPVIHLPFLSRRRHNHRARLGLARAPQLLHEAPYARIRARVAVLVDQALPDRHRVRPMPRPSSITSRYGSHRLAAGGRLGAPTIEAAKSVRAPSRLAGFGGD
jgi:hypothetical protein